MIITEKFSNLKMRNMLGEMEYTLSRGTVARVEYDLLYDNYCSAKMWALTRLSTPCIEVRNFPMFDDMDNILWTVAEFRGADGELVEFRRDGYTGIEVTFYKSDKD
jgi:hypothetical protein